MGTIGQSGTALRCGRSSPMAPLSGRKGDVLLQQQRQNCELGKVKVEPREGYETPDGSDVGF
eukprot:c1276_g1_i1 orf=99-284(+)